MKIDLRNVRCEWVNLEKDTEKAEQMVELLDRLGVENHSRANAITGIEPHPGVRKGEEHYRSCAESHFEILQRAIDNNDFPVMILEDDVDTEKDLGEIEIPDDADMLYIGTSHGDGNFTTNPVDENVNKITQVFATHAIVYFNAAVAKQVIEAGKISIYKMNRPFDVAIAYQVQPAFSVYAMTQPIFFQSDAKNEKNKWEEMTKTPLPIKPKKSMWKTVGV